MKEKVQSPQRYIPRKPHKNGLLNYIASFKTDHGPYLFDLEPDYLANNPVNSRTALLKFLYRWPWTERVHVTIDAGFSDMDVLDVMKDKHMLLHRINQQGAQEACF
ncbi:MAG: hypothetical protein L0287_01050 [Anaerolineae bacterium]|nr:hypothetical protein [Anaerolineae bacterium]